LVKAKKVSKTFRDKVIFWEGDEAKEMYVIESGRVKITKRVYGIMVKIADLEKGDFFGEMALLDNAPRSATALAMGKVQLAAYNQSELTNFIKSDPEMTIKMLKAMSQRLRKIDSELTQLVAKGRLPKEEVKKIGKYSFF